MPHSPLVGALAGLAATAAMTLAMGALWRRLPRRERYPLPPREITSTLAARTGIERHLDERQRVDATLLSHFAYGAGAGALFPVLARRASVPRGIAYGLGVWAASYLGWLPAMRVLRPATQHPAARNALMLAAHVVWGAMLAINANGLRRAADDAFAQGPFRDARG
ncbi:MAG TPA: hypothetical protein VD965_03110 [Burkholderiales bacterium]|nr:hypothetical protein [Burkholderiales bacterium]